MEWCYPLQRPHPLRELILDEDSTLGRSEVSPSLFQLLTIERLVDNANARSASDCYANHARDVAQVAFSKTFCTVERVYPNNHFIFIEFIGELVVVRGVFRSVISIDLFQLIKVLPVAIFLHVKVFKERLL